MEVQNGRELYELKTFENHGGWAFEEGRPNVWPEGDIRSYVR